MSLRRGVILWLLVMGHLCLWVQFYKHRWGLAVYAAAFYATAYVYAQLTRPKGLL